MYDSSSGSGGVNRAILAAGLPMKEKLETAAFEWAKSGRSREHLHTGKALLVSQCWLYSTGNYKPGGAGFDSTISDFIVASRTALGGDAGWNALLAEKTMCSACRLRFHLENIGICTGCMEYVCGGCQSKHAKCGGEIVG